MLRFSIRHLLLATALIAGGCAALLNANVAVAAALMGGVVLLMAASLLLVIFREGQQRAWWLGFAIFGWLYLLVWLYGARDSTGFNVSVDPLGRSNLITAQVSRLAFDRIYSARQQAAIATADRAAIGFLEGSTVMGGEGMSFGDMGMGSTSGLPAPPVIVFTGPDLNHFLNVAHALWTLLLAVSGGWFALWLYTTRPASAPKAG